MAEIAERPARRSIGAQRNPASEEAILAAAQAVLMENGLAGFSIEAVARRARAGKPTIYRWWPSKAALLLDVYHNHKRTHFSHAPKGNLRDDLIVYLNNLFSAWRNPTTGALFRSVVAEAQADADTAAALTAYMADRRCQSSAIVIEAKARGEVRDDIDPELVTELLSSFAWGRLLTDRLGDDDADIIKTVDMLLSGIARS